MSSSLERSSANTSVWSTFEGQVLEGKYHLTRLISSGSFGGVFEADEVVADQLIRRVAVKLITPDAELPERQMQELVLATRLDHPNILRCYSPGLCTVRGVRLLYIAMELAARSLSLRFIEGRLDVAEAVGIAESVLSALVYLGSGEQPMVHRDVKPANILLVNGVWKLADFGLLRGIGPERVAQTRTLLGTAEYAPPEAFEGIVSPGWDVWSLGVVLVEALTGHLPYDEAGPHELQRAIMTQPARHVEGLPDPIGEVARGCLCRERTSRWSAEQALAVLRGTAAAPDSHHASPTSRQRELVERRAKFPFRFKFDSAETLPEFIRICEAYPYEAQDYLMNRYVGRWMSEALDDAALAREANGYGQMHWHEPERAIELFVREMRQMVGMPYDPGVVVSPHRLDFGLLYVGERKTESVRYHCELRGHVWGMTRLDGNLPGITPEKEFGRAAAPVAIHLDTLDVPPGHYEGAVLFVCAGLPEATRVPITYTVAPVKAKVSPAQIDLGLLPFGAVRSGEIEIAPTGSGGRIKGRAEIVPPTAGLRVTDEFVGERSVIVVEADARVLEAGREYVRRVRLESSAGVYEVPVRLTTMVRYRTVWIYAFTMAIGMGLVVACLRAAIAASIGDSHHWFLSFGAESSYDTLFRIVGTPLFAVTAGLLFQRFARWKWPLTFERQQAETEARSRSAAQQREAVHSAARAEMDRGAERFRIDRP